MNRLHLQLIFLASIVLQGCTIGPQPIANDPQYAPVIAPTAAMTQPNSGGIYRPNNGMVLFEDNRAHRIGDIVTIILTERTVATKSAETEIKKENAITFDQGTVLGNPVTAGGMNLSTSLSQNRDFSGESGSDQSNSLQGQIAVTVSAVLPNGLLEVRGEKWMTLNSGEEFIRVRGLVRTDDIGPDNTIASNKLADARISYSGTGEFADSNKQGWASRFFNSVFWIF